jgi:hypothetical protein
MTYPWDLNNRFNAAFPNSRGVSLNTPPAFPAGGAEPFRLDPAAMQAWRANTPLPSPVDQPVNSMVPPAVNNPPTPLAAFPTGGAAPVPNAPAPVVQAGGPSGLTLNSAPPAQDWSGSVGQTAPAAAPPAANPNWDKLAEAGADALKAFKRPTSTDMNTITPMSAGPTGGGGGQMGANLLAQLLANSRRNYGTGGI